MRELRGNLAIAGILLGLVCAAAPAGAATTSATVAVTITVLPYAEVTVEPTAEVYLPDEGGSSAMVYVGGTVTCNCPVVLFADIEPPTGAPGRWYAAVMVPEVNEPGVHTYPQLVRIYVANVPAESAGTFSLDILGTKLGDYPFPQPGQVVVTVMVK